MPGMLAKPGILMFQNILYFALFFATLPPMSLSRSSPNFVHVQW